MEPEVSLPTAFDLLVNQAKQLRRRLSEAELLCLLPSFNGHLL